MGNNDDIENKPKGEKMIIIYSAIRMKITILMLMMLVTTIGSRPPPNWQQPRGERVRAMPCEDSE